MALVACLGMVAPAAFGQDLYAGMDAYALGDYATALKEWVPLAEAGDAEAQYGLGQMYRYGEGVALDVTEAMRWFRLAAAQGHNYAQSNLSLMYLKGEGGAQDSLLAFMWSDIAAASGNQIFVALRDEIAAGLSPEELSQAQAMSQTCVASNFADCGG